MRHGWLRALIASTFVTLHLAAGVVSAFGVCCQHEGSSSGPTMECCLKGGKNHICPFMSKKSRIPSTKESLRAPCAAGHDAGMPVGGFLAPPLGSVEAPRPAEAAVPVVSAVPVVLATDISPPAPPPKA